MALDNFTAKPFRLGEPLAVSSGLIVKRVSSGSEADAALASHEFDMVILDLGLPMVDGLTVLRRVREAGRTLPILVLTALDALEHRVAGLQAGADDYLTKPFDFPELEARLHALMRRGRPAGAAQQLRGLTLDRARALRGCT